MTQIYSFDDVYEWKIYIGNADADDTYDDAYYDDDAFDDKDGEWWL